MRDHARFRPTFWTKGSGKRLRGDRDAQLVGAYLITSEAATMCGIYYLPLPTIAHHLAMELEGLRATLARVAAVDLAYYDEETEMVWVPNLAEQEIGKTMSSADRRHRGIQRAVESIGEHRFVVDFYRRYAEAYTLPIPGWCQRHLGDDAGAKRPDARSSEAPSEPSSESERASYARVRASAPGNGTGEASVCEGVQGEAAPETAHDRPRDPAGDHSIGDAWAMGAADGLGCPVTRPSPGETRKLADAVATHAKAIPVAAIAQRTEWVRDRARRWGETKPKPVNVWRFVEWLDGGCVAQRAPPSRIVQPSNPNSPWMKD